MDPASDPEFAPGHDPYAVFRLASYCRFLVANVLASAGAEMQVVAVGWELYERTHSAQAPRPRRPGDGPAGPLARLAGRPRGGPLPKEAADPGLARADDRRLDRPDGPVAAPGAGRAGLCRPVRGGDRPRHQHAGPVVDPPATRAGPPRRRGGDVEQQRAGRSPRSSARPWAGWSSPGRAGRRGSMRSTWSSPSP